ncbi:hypothetical protein Q5752_003649 [Cryptotrichosporon argae]
MAPLLLSHFRPRHRTFLTSIFTATFLGAVVVVAFPCPARTDVRAGLASPDGRDGAVGKEVVVMMNQRRRRFLEE